MTDLYHIANSQTVIESALGYVEAGFSVVPLTGKKPARFYNPNNRRWQSFQWAVAQHRRATFSHVHNWQERGWLENVGIVCGKVSGNLVVIDLDGESAVDEFKATYPHLWQGTYVVISGSGKGAHVYLYTMILPPTTRTKGFELRANGCYVVAPPSLHPETKQPYKPVDNDMQILVLDELEDVVNWIMGKMKSQQRQAKPVDIQLPTSSYGSKALTGEIDRLRGAAAGERNNTLNLSAFRMGQLIATGTIDRGQVEAALLGAALAIGLPENESLRTINSGINGGLRKPRGVIR